MSTPVTFNGVNYSIPAFGDVGYAQGPGNLSSYFIALASGTLQATGGLFSLTSQANFGPNFGLTAFDFISVTTLPATAGVVRLAKTDAIEWRNNANGANLPLAINGSDQLTFNSVIIATAVATASRALASDANGLPVASATTAVELAYSSGVTSAIQTQLNAKQATLTAGQLPGTATNDSATAGNVGEFIISAVSSVAASASSSFSDITSISLTAGDWDVTLFMTVNSTNVGSVAYVAVGISSTPGNNAAGLANYSTLASSNLVGSPTVLIIPALRVTISTTTTYYAKGYSSYSGTTPYYAGRLSARRVR